MTKEEKLNNAKSLLIEEQDRASLLQEELNRKAEELSKLDQECRILQSEINKSKIRVDLRKEDLEKIKSE